MFQIKHIDGALSTLGKFKMEKSVYNKLRVHYCLAKITFWPFVFLGLVLVFFFKSHASSPPAPADVSRRSLRTSSYGGANWEKRARAFAKIRSRNRICVLVTGAAVFVGSHVFYALKRRGDGVLGLDNFNYYYDPSLKRARQALLELLERNGVYIVEGDVNDLSLLRKLFDLWHSRVLCIWQRRPMFGMQWRIPVPM